MKLNEHTKLIGSKVILVPYEEYHVPIYHEWMKSEELQKLTASEPLSLEDEYGMQKSWRVDEDKCTFIILDKSRFEETENELTSMIGDTNIFITDGGEKKQGEIEIMVAETKARGKKFGWEAIILMLLYGMKFLKLTSFIAKISLDNNISLKMFEKLGFVELSKSEVFKEITLKKDVDENWIRWLENESNFTIGSYETAKNLSNKT